MVSLPKQKVREVHLRCRFCTQYHFNSHNKGITFLPRDQLNKPGTLNLPYTYRNIPHSEHVEYDGNLSVATLAHMRHAASRFAYEEGILQLYHSFVYISSDSQSSIENSD